MLRSPGSKRAEHKRGLGCRMHGREAHEGACICILVVDSCCCAAEINTTL